MSGLLGGFFSGPLDLLSGFAPGWMPQQTKRGTFTTKQLDVTLMLGTGAWGIGGQNVLKLTGLRVSASIVIQGAFGIGSAQIRVWGMTFDQMNQLATLGKQRFQARKNTILLEAGDDTSAVRSIVYTGDVHDAWADFQAQPDVPFHFTCYTGQMMKLKPIPPRSQKGSVDVAALAQAYAQSEGLVFENSGVDVKLVDQYLPGCLLDQLRAACEAGNVMYTISHDTIPSILAIWPKGGERGGAIPIISPQTGMVGYPTFTAKGIVATTVYNPSIRFGSKVQVQSQLQPACGEWYVGNLTHTLDSEMPGGNWFTRFEGWENAIQATMGTRQAAP